MNYEGPAYLVPEILIGTVAVAAVALYGLRRVLNRTGWPEEERQRAFWGGSALLTGWLLAALVLSWVGFYEGSLAGIPRLPLGLLVPIAAGLLLFPRWPLLRRIVDAIPQKWLVGIQTYRAEGVIFLILYASGRLPGAFALPAGIGDVIVGVLAMITAISYRDGGRGSTAWLRTWNLLGMADLAVAVTTGFLTSPSPVQLLALDRPNTLVTAFPLVLIPVFLVPLSVLLHLASLRKLSGIARESRERKAFAAVAH